ncbi:LOW QUALITY PROTEIN: hypothetical protein NC652_001659 [Populus alba x Populus x berolinensis]|nr:LOW QUALITY PROTEIN: hypothetical protein NC652_001659 [Populus alba x Populus x berolinensis]
MYCTVSSTYCYSTYILQYIIVLETFSSFIGNWPFSDRSSSYGIFGPNSGTQRLPRLVGKSLAKELIFTGRKIDGREAMSMGLVNYSVPAGEAHSKALEIAREVIQKGPIAIRMAKKAINEGLEIDLPSALELEEECYEQLLNTKDRLEGLAAFAEKRKPSYRGE